MVERGICNLYIYTTQNAYTQQLRQLAQLHSSLQREHGGNVHQLTLAVGMLSPVLDTAILWKLFFHAFLTEVPTAASAPPGGRGDAGSHANVGRRCWGAYTASSFGAAPTGPCQAAAAVPASASGSVASASGTVKRHAVSTPSLRCAPASADPHRLSVVANVVHGLASILVARSWQLTGSTARWTAGSVVCAGFCVDALSRTAD